MSKLVTRNFILSRHKDWSNGSIGALVHCGQLKPHEDRHHTTRQLYDYGEFLKLDKERPELRPSSDYPTFTDGELVWLADVAAVRKYKVDRSTLYDACEAGRLAWRHVRIEGRSRPVRFILERASAEETRTDTLAVAFKDYPHPDRTAAQRSKKQLDKATDNDIANRHEVKHFGFGGTKGMSYLKWYSAPAPYPKRGKPRKVHNHPAFNPPRPIGTGQQSPHHVGNRHAGLRGWNIGDLRTVREYIDNGAKGLTPLPKDGLLGLSKETIIHFIKAGLVVGGQHPYHRSNGDLQTNRWMVNLDSLKTAPTYKNRVGESRMVAVLDGGKLIDYWPSTEAIRLVHYGAPHGDIPANGKWLVDLLDLFHWTPKEYGGDGRDCPELGRPIRCRRSMVSRGDRRKATDKRDRTIFSGDDLRAIEAKRRRWPAPRQPWPVPNTTHAETPILHEIKAGVDNINRRTRKMHKGDKARDAAIEQHAAEQKAGQQTVMEWAKAAGKGDAKPDMIPPGEGMALFRFGDATDAEKRKVYAKIIACLPTGEKGKDGRINVASRAALKRIAATLKAQSNNPTTDWSDAVDEVAEVERRKAAANAKKPHDLT